MAYPNLDPIIVDNPSGLPDISQITSKSLQGTGIFDTLMRTLTLHIDDQYTKERISGEEYAQVYLGAMTAALQQSIAYLVTQQQVKKIDADIGLVRQQTVSELAQTDDTIPTDLGFNGTTAIEGLVANQIALTTNQIALAAKQADLVDEQILGAAAEKDLIGQRIVTELSQTGDDITDVKLAGHGFNMSDTVISLAESNRDKIIAEKDLIGQRIVTELAQADDNITDVKLAGYGFNTLNTIISLAASNKDKIVAEKDLTGQRIITELAQTDASLSGAISTYGFNDSASIESIAKSTNDKLIADTDLTIQKVVTEVAQTSNTKPDDLGKMAGTAIAGLVSDQKLVNAAQIAKLGTEADLTTQKIVTEVAQTSNTKPLNLGQIPGTDITGLVSDQKLINAAQIAKLGTESDLTLQKIVTEVAQTSDTKPNDLGQVTGTAITGLISDQKLVNAAQIAKLTEEAALVKQKTDTELAQVSDFVGARYTQELWYAFTNDSVVANDIVIGNANGFTSEGACDTAISNAVSDGRIASGVASSEMVTVLIPVNPIAGKTKRENDLYEKQKDGFDRDAEQKFLKIMTDIFVTEISKGHRTSDVNSVTTNTPLGTLVTRVAEGIDLTLTGSAD